VNALRHAVRWHPRGNYRALRSLPHSTSTEERILVTEHQSRNGREVHNLTGPVGISIEGIPLGSFSITLDGSGQGQLVVPLDDSFIAQVITAAAGSSVTRINFTLNPSDFFRITTDDDLRLDLNNQQDAYGTGISTVTAKLFTN